jgi:hypothetical protein
MADETSGASNDTQNDTQNLPSLEVAGLRVWLHRRQFPSSHDLDEGNLIAATIRCDHEGVTVRADDASVRSSDIARWTKELRALQKGTSALARLSLKKGIFEIILQATEDLSLILMRVAVAGNGLPARTYEFVLQRGALDDILRQCGEMLTAFPVRGATLHEAA